MQTLRTAVALLAEQRWGCDVVVRPMRRAVEATSIGVVCAYEFAALVAHSEKLPTITTLVGRLPRRYRTVVSVMSAVWLICHFEFRS